MPNNQFMCRLAVVWEITTLESSLQVSTVSQLQERPTGFKVVLVHIRFF